MRLPLPGWLDEIGQRPGCRVLPPCGQPDLAGRVIPDDLREFYRLCGGVRLFEDELYPWRVSGPHELVPAGPRLLTPEIAEQVAREYPDDPTNGCYVIADGGEGSSTEAHVVIDLHPGRAGRCYSVSWETFGLVDQMPVVARDVAELFRWLLATDPDTGAQPETSYGDAYDIP